MSAEDPTILYPYRKLVNRGYIQRPKCSCGRPFRLEVARLPMTRMIFLLKYSKLIYTRLEPYDEDEKLTVYAWTGRYLHCDVTIRALESRRLPTKEERPMLQPNLMPGFCSTSCPKLEKARALWLEAGCKALSKVTQDQLGFGVENDWRVNYRLYQSLVTHVIKQSSVVASLPEFTMNTGYRHRDALGRLTYGYFPDEVDKLLKEGHIYPEGTFVKDISTYNDKVKLVKNGR